MNDKQQIDEKALRGVRIGHYRTLVQALTMAMMKCMAWRDADGGQTFSAKDLFDFAQKYDELHPLDDDQFYMVSREGAIGLSPGLEWLTQWMFIPMAPGAERDAVVDHMRLQLQQERAAQEAIEQAVQRGLAAEKQDVEVVATAAVTVDDDDDDDEATVVASSSTIIN